MTLLNACTLASQKEPELQGSLFISDFESFKTEDFSREITRLKKIGREYPDPLIRAQAHFHLAMIYMYQNNPGTNFVESLQEFRILKKSKKVETLKYNINNWIFLLDTIIKNKKSITQKQTNYKKLLTNHKLLIKNNKILKKEILKSEKEIQNLKEIIEKLDSIHLNIEKKKRKKNYQ